MLMIVANVLLFVSYLSLFYSEWGQVAKLPLAGPVRWDVPFRTDIGFVGPSNGPSDKWSRNDISLEFHTVIDDNDS